jgi:hypothetical protein
MPTLEELEAERKEKMRKLAVMLENKQKYANWVHEQEQKKRDELAYEQAQAKKRWGDEAAKGAATGFAVSGSPWGALIGGGVGTLSGMHGAYKQRRKEGSDPLGSTIATLTDFPSYLPSGEASTGVAKPVAEGVAGYKSRTGDMGTKSSPMQDIQELGADNRQINRPGEERPIDKWEFSEEELDPERKDTYEDIMRILATKGKKV